MLGLPATSGTVGGAMAGPADGPASSSATAYSPGMPQPLRDEERSAFEILRQITGIPVRQLDDNTRPGMVDGWWPLPGGGRAVVEVRLVVDRAAAEVASRLGDHENELMVDGLQDAWHVNVGPAVRVAELLRDLPALLRWCEGLDLDNFEGLRWERVDRAPWLERYILDRALHAHRSRGVRPGGRVSLLRPPVGGPVGNGDTVAGWIADLLSASELGRHLEKLERAEADERHLWLGVDMSGAPFAAYYPLMDETVVPETDPVVPAHLDAVWLFVHIWAPVLLWRRGEGWSRPSLAEGREASPEP
jgi:hypothetical protein